MTGDHTESHCPSCNSGRVVGGRFVSSKGGPISYVPADAKWWKRAFGIGTLLVGATPAGSPASGCADCGLVWGRIPAESLHSHDSPEPLPGSR